MAKKTRNSESEALYELLAKEYNALDLHKIIYVQQMQDGSFGIKLNGQKVPDEQLANLKSEAEILLRGQLWPIIRETLKNAAHNYMFTQMKTLEDSHYGKTMLYNLSVIETVLEALKNPYKPPKPQNYGDKLSTPPRM